MLSHIPVAVCLFAVAGLMAAEKVESRKGVWFFKPVAAGAYVWFALSLGAMATPYGRWLLLGLILCWWGDVLLIPKQNRRWFRAGILAFLAGHLAYVAAFLQLPRGWTGLIIGILLSAALAWIVLSWLGTKLPQAFRRLVVVYVVVICSMLVAAFWVADGSGIWRIALGASLFALSDISVARDRFVSKGFVNRAWGLPLYFVAQLILASTVSG